jgi:hypothetical protein
MSILDPLLQIEEEHDLWGPEVQGVKLWPAIRSQTMDTCIRRALDYHYGFGGKQRPSPPFLKTYRSQHARTLAFLIPFRPVKRASMLFFTLANDGFHEYFYRRVERPRIVEALYAHAVTERDWSTAGYQMLLEETVRVVAAVLGKVLKPPVAAARQIHEFSSHVASIFDLPAQAPHYASAITKYLKFARFLDTGFARPILKNLACCTVFMREASYLGYLGIWTRWLHQRGFKIAELQHAMMYRDHYAYNYPPSVTHQPDHPAREYLPDVFLTFGDYWRAHMRVPYSTTSIGFPRLSENVQRVQHIDANPRQIVVLSEQKQSIADLVVRLSRLLPTYQIIFKLHPVEAMLNTHYAELFGLPNVNVIERCNLYELFAESGIIIGEATTALFEAFALRNRRLFVYDNPLMPAEIATRFGTADSLVALLEDPNTGMINSSVGEFFATDWAQRIDAFLAQRK